MSFSRDLLDQANHLAQRDKLKPRQANLRRAVSAAYYSLFHQLSTDASERMSPARPAGLRKRFARAFNHGDMKKVCIQVAGQGPTSAMKQAGLSQVSGDLKLVARTFVDLQVARHDADDDLSSEFDRATVAELLLQTEQATKTWLSIRSSDEANVFLVALLLSERWAK